MAGSVPLPGRMRLLFLLLVMTAFIMLPMRHVVVISSTGGVPAKPRSAAHRPTSGDSRQQQDPQDALLGSTDAEDDHAESSSAAAGRREAVHDASASSGHRRQSNEEREDEAGAEGDGGGGPHEEEDGGPSSPRSAVRVALDPPDAEERAQLVQELGINENALPKRSAASQQESVDMSPREAGGAFRNPYRVMQRTGKPCRGGRHARGKWVYDETLKPPYPSVGEILGSCQRGYEEEHGKGAQRPETKYRWVPDDCDLIPFSEETFCKALRGRDIMFAGDSLTDHWHASLVYLLGLHGNDIYRKEGTVQRKRACQTHPICGKYYKKPLRIYFLTNQLLQQTSMRNRNHKWWKHIRQYSLLVLNAGSWMRDPTNEEREVSDTEYEGHMRKAVKLVKALFNGTVVWRTTYQGHPYCWEYSKPLTEELRADAFPTVVPYKRYRWAAIPGRNRFSTDLWRAEGAHILDITRPTNLMPLGHLGRNHPKYKLRNTTDCLHYCSPGPYDLWSQLLMNLLLGNIDGV